MTAPITEAELAQFDQWYRDPVRTLPLKVKRDVATLIAEIRESRKLDEQVREGLAWIDGVTSGAACAFCSPRDGGEVMGNLREHMRTCEKHPLSKMRRVLEWLDRCGGLGSDKHERIRAALAPDGGSDHE